MREHGGIGILKDEAWQGKRAALDRSLARSVLRSLLRMTRGDRESTDGGEGAEMIMGALEEPVPLVPAQLYPMYTARHLEV